MVVCICTKVSAASLVTIIMRCPCEKLPPSSRHSANRNGLSATNFHAPVCARMNLHLHEQCTTQWALHITYLHIKRKWMPKLHNQRSKDDTKYLLHISNRKEALCV